MLKRVKPEACRDDLNLLLREAASLCLQEIIELDSANAEVLTRPWSHLNTFCVSDCKIKTYV